jgi:hypothetical protein
MTVKIDDGWLTGSLPDDTGHEWPIVQRRQESVRGPLRPGTPNLILHTTETDRFLDTLRFPSQWQCGDGKIGQHIKLGLAGDAVNTWDAWAQQIEMVGRSQLVRWLPKASTLGPVIALVAWLHDTGRIRTGIARPHGWPIVLDRGPQAVTTYYRRIAGLWPDMAGVYGHVDIPDNSHWDPGSFDYPTFFARVQATLAKGEDMSDDRLDQMQAGTDAFWDAFAAKNGDPGGAPQDKAPWFRKGWGNARKGALNPKAGGTTEGLKRGDTVTLT